MVSLVGASQPVQEHWALRDQMDLLARSLRNHITTPLRGVVSICLPSETKILRNPLLFGATANNLRIGFMEAETATPSSVVVIALDQRLNSFFCFLLTKTNDRLAVQNLVTTWFLIHFLIVDASWILLYVFAFCCCWGLPEQRHPSPQRVATGMEQLRNHSKAFKAMTTNKKLQELHRNTANRPYQNLFSVELRLNEGGITDSGSSSSLTSNTWYFEALPRMTRWSLVHILPANSARCPTLGISQVSMKSMGSNHGGISKHT